MELKALHIATVSNTAYVSHMPAFTLTLDDDTAKRIRSLVAPYAGTVPGYAANIAGTFSKLDRQDQDEIWTLIELKLKRHEKLARPPASKHSESMGAIPAIASH